MNARLERRHGVLLAAGAWLLLGATPLRDVLESRMSTHMLLQLPLLALIGYYAGKVWTSAPPTGAAARALRSAQMLNAGGITGLVFSSFAMILWMLPRLLDEARLDGAVDAVKLLSVPAAGLAVALSWPRVPVIARAVVHLEVIATLLRFGWGYLAADERLCLAYLADDQQRTGLALLWLGGIYSVALAWRPMFGGWPAWLRAWRKSRPENYRLDA